MIKFTYSNEIWLVLILKIVGLGLLWYFFFSHPTPKLNHFALLNHFLNH
jgi:hypothetical protein